MSKKEKVIVGMSGGVDSSIALLLLKQQGYEPIGVSLKYAVWEDECNEIKENVCCSEESFKIAENICKKLDCEYKIVDVSEKFQKEVVDYFKSELKENRTPNPCVVCNRRLKFKELISYADKNNIKYVATGHYARIKTNKNREPQLCRSKDTEKDQTYTLSFIKKEWLERIIFPLGDYTKKEIYEIADKAGFKDFHKKPESQDFCFIGKKAMSKFLEKVIGINSGPIKDTEDNVIGQHRGLHFYTIGQRKGLQISNGPYFVANYDLENNALVVCKGNDNKKLFKKELYLSPCNFFREKPNKKLKVKAKIRYRQDAKSAVIHPEKDGMVKLVFDEPVRAITEGQYAVIYDGQNCIASGKIILLKTRLN